MSGTQSFAKLIADTPPTLWVPVEGIFYKANSGKAVYEIPSLEMHCDNEKCNGVMTWDPEVSNRLSDGGWWDDLEKIVRSWVGFKCRHCRSNHVNYCWIIIRPAKSADGKFCKVGQDPFFTPFVPERVKKLVGSERDYFFKGRRAESMALGIAAFAYYRRVVENRKDQLLEEIIKVAATVGSSPDLIENLQKARNDPQFTKSIGEFTPAVPESLLLKGHNPLNLLHSALSHGLHSQTDEECLEAATHIRIVLAHLTERMDAALAEHKELDESVARLISKHVAKKSGPQ